MSAITAKASRKMKKYAVLTREPRCFLGSFDFSWEQRKLGDIADIVGGGTPSTGNQSYWDGDIDWYAPAEIADQIYANSSQKKITGLGYENSSAKMLPPGTVLFTSRAGIGKTAILTRKGCTNQGFQSIVPHRGELDSYFIFSRTEELKRYGELVGAGSTFVEVSGKQMAVMELMMPPTMREQQTIGGFFQQLDHLITLHQRKCALLFSPFQAFISMMFTTSTFSWEQRKLSEITDKVTEKNAGLQYVETFTNSAEFGIISQRDFFDHDIAKLGSLDGYYIVKTEDFVYNPRISTSAPVGPINRNKLGRTGVMSPLYTVFRPHDIDTTYLEYFFKCGYWHSFMNFNGDSGARSDRFSIRDNVFFQMPIPIPDIDEQRKIGELLTCLDNLITLHQRKCIFFTGRAGRLISTVNKKRITSSWEQRKLASLCEKFTDGDWIESKDQSDFGVRLVQTGNVGVAEYLDKTNNKKWISEDTFDRLHCEEVLPGDILISRLPEPAGRACIVPLLGTKMITAVDCTIVRTAPDMSNKFLVQYLSSQAYFDDVNTCLAGGTRQRISRGNLANFNVPIPVKKSEQDAIGMFFGYLDNLIYYAERNTGAFQNHFITFSENPKLVEIKGKDIYEKVRYCHQFNEVANTNIQRVFELILKTAVKNRVPQKDMPAKLYIISDMEFDYCTEDCSMTNFEYAQRLFEERGYQLPEVVFWNVASRNQQQPVKVNDRGVALVSGCNPRIFSMLKSGVLSPYAFMMDVLGSERYAAIVA